MIPHFTETTHCLSRAHCVTCRAQTEAGARWRKDIGAPSECPYGVPLNYAGGFRAGDFAEKTIKVLGLDKAAQLYERLTGKPCGCAERQKALNALASTVKT